MITHDYKLIFIHIPKCAGRSICNFFNQRFDHFTANYYSKEYPRYWSVYDKFTIVRNPYARLVSIYHYIQEHRRHASEPIAVRPHDPPTFKHWVIENFKALHGQFHFGSPEAQRADDGQLGSRFWFSSQVRFLSNGEDYFSKYLFENIKTFRLEDGMNKLKDFLESKVGKAVEIPIINTSRHKPWQEYYDSELKEFLKDKKFIIEDCLAFNYKME